MSKLNEYLLKEPVIFSVTIIIAAVIFVILFKVTNKFNCSNRMLFAPAIICALAVLATVISDWINSEMINLTLYIYFIMEMVYTFLISTTILIIKRSARLFIPLLISMYAFCLSCIGFLFSKGEISWDYVTISFFAFAGILIITLGVFFYKKR